MNCTITIVPVTQNDAETLHILHSKSFCPVWNRETFRFFLQDPQTTAFASLAVENPYRITGFVLARLAAGEAEILSIAVDPDYRKTGVGHALMDAILRKLYQDNAEILFLEVDEKNIPARTLYKRFGFIQTGRRPRYYQSKTGHSDALILQRRLG